MKKPEYTKPFDLDAAKAGAPFCCRSGIDAEILKWDRKHTFCIVGLAVLDASLRRWRADGSYSELLNDHDLVMLPLGFIDGKPVFVGDEFIGHANTPCVAKAGLSSNFDGCRWPAPAPVYPKLVMKGADITAFCQKSGADVRFDWLPITGEHKTIAGPVTMTVNMAGSAAPFDAIANFALRHAIDAGQVVPAGDAAARDLAVAQAASEATFNAIYRNGSHRVAFCDLGLDLPAIIAGVAK